MATPAPASVQRRDDALAFAGVLSRDAVPGLWQQALRAEKVVLRKRPSRQLIRVRKHARRILRRAFR